MKDYQEVINSVSKFNRVFKRGQIFNDTYLSKSCPCDICDHNEEVTPLNCYDERTIEYKKYCKECCKIITWYMDCIVKLNEYESIDINPHALQNKVKSV